MDWPKLIAERNEWVAKNFAQDNGLETTFGVFEEYGELVHHYLKQMQGIRGTREEHDEGMKDAIGDMTVYLLGVMNASGLNSFSTDSHDYVGMMLDRCVLEMPTHLAALTRPYLNLGIGLMGWHMGQLIKWMASFCKLQGWDYEIVVMSTWNHVKKRDWTKHREEGAQRDDPAVKDPYSTIPKETPYG